MNESNSLFFFCYIHIVLLFMIFFLHIFGFFTIGICSAFVHNNHNLNLFVVHFFIFFAPPVSILSARRINFWKAGFILLRFPSTLSTCPCPRAGLQPSSKRQPVTLHVTHFGISWQAAAVQVTGCPTASAGCGCHGRSGLLHSAFSIGFE